MCAATSGMVGRTWSGNVEPSCLRMQAHACADVDAHSCSDRHTHACADIDSYTVADRHAHACADVDVRACLDAPHHARCGLTGTHAQACTMPHARAQAHAHNHGPSRIMSPSCSHLRRDRAGTAPALVGRFRAGTEADLRCD